MDHPLRQPDGTWPCDHCGALVPPRRGKRHAHRFAFLCAACHDRCYLVHYSVGNQGWYVVNTRTQAQEGPFYADRAAALRQANNLEGYPDGGRRYVIQQIARRRWCVIDSLTRSFAEGLTFERGRWRGRQPSYARREQALAVANTFERHRDHAAEAYDKALRALAWYPPEQRSRLMKLRQRVRGTTQPEDRV
jgi:hypothetical protein